VRTERGREVNSLEETIQRRWRRFSEREKGIHREMAKREQDWTLLYGSIARGGHVRCRTLKGDSSAFAKRTHQQKKKRSRRKKRKGRKEHVNEGGPDVASTKKRTQEWRAYDQIGFASLIMWIFQDRKKPRA